MNKNSGVTMITLIIMIIVLLILAGVSINGTIIGNNSSQSNIKKTELEMVQHAIVERYTKYKLTKDSSLLIGTITIPENNAEEGLTWKLTQGQIGTDVEKKYYQLNSANLKEIGFTSETTDSYIVNYYTGEVYNTTQHKTKNGELLYIYIKSES